MSKNAIEFWYPKIKEIVRTPQTIIVPVECNWDETGNYKVIPKKYVDEIVEKSKSFEFPIFLRASDSSIKHSWKDTCFVGREEDLPKRIQHIANECENLDPFGGVAVTSFAVREYIEMDSRFKFFWGDLPINPEQRYFINNHKIICHHPYWTMESIKDEKYASVLEEMNTLSNEDKNIVNRMSCEIANIFDDYWSVDFCKSKNGEWICIDMADGKRSWHPECNFKM